MLALVGPEAKDELRAASLAARAALPAEARAAAAAAIQARVLTLDPVASARVIAGYVGVGSEIATLPLLDTLVARGVAVLLPVLRPDRSLAWGRYESALVEGRFGLLEPATASAPLSSADVVLVPGVAFDRAGRRLGRGGGSYDRALATVTAFTIGLALDSEVVDEVPVEPHDRPVSAIVTPTRVIYAGTETPTPPRVSPP